MRKQKIAEEELLDLVDNLYLQGRQMRSMENKPRYYGSDILLYPNEVYTLKVIAQQEGINQTQLSEQMFRTKGATSAVVQKLKQKGLVEQREDKNDSRFSQLYPTEKGKEVYQNHLEYDKRYVARLSRHLDISMEELAQMNRILRMMNQDVIRRYKEHGASDFDEDKSALMRDAD